MDRIFGEKLPWYVRRDNEKKQQQPEQEQPNDDTSKSSV